MSDFLEIFFMCIATLGALALCFLPVAVMTQVGDYVEKKLYERDVSYDIRTLARMFIEIVGILVSLSLLFAVGATAYKFAT